jgi:hypothetical protein
VCRPQNVHGVNLGGVNLRDGKFDFGAGGEKGKKILALKPGELLGIVQAFEFVWQTGSRPFGRQNGRRRHDWPRKRTAPGLVHARNTRRAAIPQYALERKAVVKFGAHFFVPSLARFGTLSAKIFREVAERRREISQLQSGWQCIPQIWLVL